MQVNAAGTGYQLVASPETTPLYCHPLRIYKGGGDGAIYALSALIFNNSSTKFTLATFKQWIRDLSDNVGTGVAATILMTGYYNDKKESPTIVQSAAYLYVLKQGENSYLYGVDGANVGGTTTASTSSESVDELFPAGSTTFVDAVNRIL